MEDQATNGGENKKDDDIEDIINNMDVELHL
jgi:hypothetical protein